MGSKKLIESNLYELLDVDCNANQLEIRQAYRKKALKCHPDKNPDNPNATRLFHELSKALEVLADESAREAYDKVLKGKKATEQRNKQLDSKRQKLKADLERRELDALHKLHKSQTYSTIQKTDEEIFQDQLERLRREGSKLLEEEQNLMKEQLRQAMQKGQQQVPHFNSTLHRIKIKWKADKKDTTNGGYNHEQLLQFLKKYGDVIALVMSKKPGSALVEFKSMEAAEMALAYEKGLLENPLNLEWLSEDSKHIMKTSSTTGSVNDFEDLVLRKLRQAEERKRLIKQMEEEDERCLS